MINYFSSIEDASKADLLEKRMSDFYKYNGNYYDDIDFGINSWFDESYLTYQDILNRCVGKKVCEVGCGKAGVLSTQKVKCSDYSGCDFSASLLESNRVKYPEAEFMEITDPKKIPFEDKKFDVVFSVFVLEHVVRPHLFLEELIRIVKPGGQIIIQCPDFYGRLGISSQLSGKYPGTGTQKLKKGYFYDTLKGVIVGRFLVPVYFLWKLRNAKNKPVFLLNNNPSCFYYPFIPDVDAVYVTHKEEIITKLKSLGAKPVALPETIEKMASSNRCIYLVFEC